MNGDIPEALLCRAEIRHFHKTARARGYIRSISTKKYTRGAFQKLNFSSTGMVLNNTAIPSFICACQQNFPHRKAQHGENFQVRHRL
jgi:hypothetical protein